nr:hypothetical protein [uncultured Prevotella sp.]
MAKNLKQYGWEYVVVDIRWFIANDKARGYNESNPVYVIGNYTVDASKPGAQEYYNSIFDMYAEWGVDFIKIDDLSAPDYHQPEIDMIPLGHIAIRGERGEDRMTRLTKDEQYSLMTFFCIFRSPLMFGGDLPSIDPFTLSLLTNKGVLKMHKDGTHVRELFNDGKKLAITSKDAKNGATYLAIFNLSDQKQQIEVPLNSLGIKGAKKATLLWDNKQVGKVKGKVKANLNPHACTLYRLD